MCSWCPRGWGKVRRIAYPPPDPGQRVGRNWMLLFSEPNSLNARNTGGPFVGPCQFVGKQKAYHGLHNPRLDFATSLFHLSLPGAQGHFGRPMNCYSGESGRMYGVAWTEQVSSGCWCCWFGVSPLVLFRFTRGPCQFMLLSCLLCFGAGDPRCPGFQGVPGVVQMFCLVCLCVRLCLSVPRFVLSV